MNELTFTQDKSLGVVSNNVLCGDDCVVTFAIKMADEKTHIAIVQQSIDCENWQNVGTVHFTEYLELNVEGLRPNIQNVRIAISDGTTPQKGLYV